MRTSTRHSASLAGRTLPSSRKDARKRRAGGAWRFGTVAIDRQTRMTQGSPIVKDSLSLYLPTFCRENRSHFLILQRIHENDGGKIRRYRLRRLVVFTLPTSETGSPSVAIPQATA